MAGQSIVPTPLALAYIHQCFLHFGLGSTVLPREFRIEVGLSQFGFHSHGEVIYLLLTLINVLSKGLRVLTMAGLAGAIDVGQGAHNVVIGEFNATFLLVRHVTIGARKAALTVNPLLKHLVTRVLRLQKDRKSTRLNSSHANISYAVFCLKKKKNIQILLFLSYL